jgi:hypothetical protein
MAAVCNVDERPVDIEVLQRRRTREHVFLPPFFCDGHDKIGSRLNSDASPNWLTRIVVFAPSLRHPHIASETSFSADRVYRRVAVAIYIGRDELYKVCITGQK